MKPFLKWVGGKTQIIDTIINNFPNEIQDYYEPFLGGGSTLLAALLSEKIKGQVFASDVNKNLINLYKEIQNNCEQFISDVHLLETEYHYYSDTKDGNRKATTLEDVDSRESYYYFIRNQFNKNQDSAKFIFLNKVCFRGVYREGPNGFNVPYGNYKNVIVINDDHIRQVSHLISRVNFIHASFEDVLENPKTGDFVYMDPPYVPINVSSFVGYTADGFNKHQQLFEKCNKIKCKWLMSNSDVPVVRNSFLNHPIEIVSCRRAINSKNPESRVNEVLVKNQ